MGSSPIWPTTRLEYAINTLSIHSMKEARMQIDPASKLRDFFSLIWGKEEGYVYVPTLDRRTNNFDVAWYKWPKMGKFLIGHVQLSAAKGLEIYFSPVLWAKPSREINRENLKYSRVIWADFDGNAPTEWPDPTIEAGSEPHTAVPGHPTVTVQSSGERNQHVYWLLDEPLTDVDEIQSINRAIAYELKADSSGWDVEQILRPPFSTNHKRNMPVLLASIDDTVVYQKNQFKNLRTPKQSASSSIETEELPSATEIIGKYDWDYDDLKLMEMEEPNPHMDRSHAYMRIAYASAEKGLSEKEIYALLLWLDSKWGKFVDRRDRTRRLMDMALKALQKYPHPVEDVTFKALLSKKKDKEKEEEPAKVDAKQVFGFEEFTQLDISVDWIIDGLISEESINLISGPAGIGKTQYAINMAISSALQKEFVGYEVNKQQKAMFLSLEMGQRRLHKLITTMAEPYSASELAKLNEQLLLVPIGQAVPFASKDAFAYVEKLLEEHEPDGLYIDSLGQVLTGDLNSDERVREFFNRLGSLRKKYGFYSVIIHHQRKVQGDNKRAYKLEDIYGSQYITSNPDTVTTLWPSATKGVIEVREVKNRLYEQRDKFTIQRLPNLGFTRVDEVDTSVEGLIGRLQESSSGANPVSGTSANPFG